MQLFIHIWCVPHGSTHAALTPGAGTLQVLSRAQLCSRSCLCARLIALAMCVLLLAGAPRAAVAIASSKRPLAVPQPVAIASSNLN